MGKIIIEHCKSWGFEDVAKGLKSTIALQLSDLQIDLAKAPKVTAKITIYWVDGDKK